MVAKSRVPARLVAGLMWAVAPCIAFAGSTHAPRVRGDAGAGHAAAPSAAHRDAAVRRGADASEAAATQVDPVVVTGWLSQQSYNMNWSATATGTQTQTLDVPQSIQVIPARVLHDQDAQSLEDAVRNAPGVYVQQGEGNRDEFYLRGVKTKSDFFVDGLRDDTEYFRDLYNVAHVDVLQGPAAMLFGRGNAGGIINLVTRQPERRRIRHVTVQGGSWGHARSTLDVGGALGASGAYRLMAMGEDSGGFRDHSYLHRYALNPKFAMRLDQRTQLEVGASYLDDRRFADRGIPSRGNRPADVPRDRFFGSVEDNVAHSRVEAFNLRIGHQFSDHLKVRNALRVTDNKRMYQNAYAAGAVDDAGRVKLKAYRHPNNRLSYLDRAEVIADAETGPLRHKLLLGAVFNWQRGNDRETLPAPDSKSLPGTVPVSDPVVGHLAFPYLDRDNHVVGKETGIYAQDQIALGRHWKALLGARWDRFSVDADYRKPGVTPDHTHNVDTEWSPRAGLIYKPVDNDSLYVSVSKSFTPQGANIALSRKGPEGAHLDPEQATNYEIGNKLDMMDGNLSLTAAVFQLELTDVVARAADGSGRLVNTGKQRNRGVELALQGALTSQWDVYANYTHMDATITSTTKDADAGARVGLVPRDQFSLWTRYALNAHWGVGAGLRGASRKYTSYDNHVMLPGFAEADLMAWYQGSGYRVQVNLDNVTDRRYYATASGDNQIMPGAPRSVDVSLTVDF